MSTEDEPCRCWIRSIRHKGHCCFAEPVLCGHYRNLASPTRGPSMSTETLTDWLLRQVADEEAVAREANHRDDDKPMPYYVVDDDWRYEVVGTNTARVLAECEAKRRIVALHRPIEQYDWNPDGHCAECSDSGWAATLDGAQPVEMPCPTLRILALPYADRPGYLEEWAPR